MSQHDTCAFCVKLPVTSHRARKIGRCPLCRSMLIETSAGTTCRFAEATGETRSRRRGYIWVMGGTGLLVAVWLGLQLLHSPPQTLSVAQADPDTTPGRPPPAVTQSPPTVIGEAPRQPAFSH